jgi:DNA repair protein RadC
MGPAKYAQLQAVLEMARRALGEDMRAGRCPEFAQGGTRLAAAQAGAAWATRCSWRCFWTAQNRVLAPEELFRGTLTQTSVYPA